MKIRLRVAGIYFNRFLNVPANGDGSPITIKNAMDFCKETYNIAKENGFDYGPKPVNMPDGRQFNVVDCISHFFSGAYDFNGDGKITPGKDNKGKTLGDNTRRAGLYALKEQTIDSSPQIRLVWQYYVRELNGDGTLRSRTMPSDSGFTSFDNFVLKDHDEVTWRLVTIQLTPTVEADKMTPKIAFDALRYM